jgi:hypothetical protein
VDSTKYNEWGGDYWLECCLELSKTLNISLSHNEGKQFLVGSMVVKGEYLAHDNNTRKKGGYVFRDYKLGAIVCHFMNLIIGANL